MSLITTDKATIICDKGSKTTMLKVTNQIHSKIQEELIATEKDKDFPLNILPFGRCSVTKYSCKCSPTSWEQTLKSKINGNKKLGKDSYMLCGVGGKIKFLDAGINDFSKSEKSKGMVSYTKEEENTQEQIDQEQKKEKIIIAIVVAILFIAIFTVLAFG